MEAATSSLRACTLKLPSCVVRRAFSSLKVRLSWTARALTMPKRTRSWISRSSWAACAARAARRCAPLGVAAPGSEFRTTLVLATVPPGDAAAEDEVEPAESGGHPPVAPDRGREERRGAEEHEAQSHHGHDPHRERPACRHARTVEQQPRPRQPSRVAAEIQREG